MSSDHQRIHPAPDVEAPSPPPVKASAPLIPPNTTKSDAGDLYFPPPPTRTHPVSYSPPPRKRSNRSCCCRLFCCLFCVILILIIAIAATVGILFLIFHPKIPKYSIDTLKITRFAPGSDGSLSATFAVNLTAHNPNKRIGIYYLDDSSLSAWYKDTLLCEGALPKFYQGHHNTTVVQVPLTGTVANANNLAASIQAQQQATGNIPLTLRGRVPIKVKLGKLKLMKMKFKVNCQLTVDSLASNNEVSIGGHSQTLPHEQLPSHAMLAPQISPSRSSSPPLLSSSPPLLSPLPPVHKVRPRYFRSNFHDSQLRMPNPKSSPPLPPRNSGHRSAFLRRR